MEEMLLNLASGQYPAGVEKLRQQLQWYVKGVYTNKREAASHVLIFMISDDQRSVKLYAIPVRVLPCRVVKDAKMRALKDDLKLTMEDIGMTVVVQHDIPAKPRQRRNTLQTHNKSTPQKQAIPPLQTAYNAYKEFLAKDTNALLLYGCMVEFGSQTAGDVVCKLDLKAVLQERWNPRGLSVRSQDRWYPRGLSVRSQDRWYPRGLSVRSQDRWYPRGLSVRSLYCLQLRNELDKHGLNT
uniref:Uncharacterized protein n=1 Tax=Branchiostoma floridae TaxID=7739 RepID=C3XT30_BRAFL|eukprot:XP_002612754.1 hypothetical protein BRAFLDRAFT_97266 [Branchiostoma floridae]